MKDLVYPRYDGHSILNIPSTILSLFGVKPNKTLLDRGYYQSIKDTEKILFFLVDGLGWDLFNKEALKYPFFQKLSKSGQFNQITSVFPSTTAAAITTINSGLSPYEHGLLEWNLFFEEFDCVIQTLPFLAVLPEDDEKIKGASGLELFNQETIYEKLNKVNIHSYVFLHRTYLTSPYNQAASRGSSIITYTNIAELVVSLRKLLSETPGRAYFYVYWGAIDGASHTFSPHSEQAKAEVSLLSYMLEHEFVKKLDKQTASSVGLMLTADHGQVPVNPAETIYLNEIKDIENYFATSSSSRIIPPTGGARDVFLTVTEEKWDEAVKVLRDYLGDRATVVKMSEVVSKGWFGNGQPHSKFDKRVGNILVLPSGYNTVWYKYAPEIEFSLLGHHGGLTPEEMLVPLISTRLSDLQ